MKIIKTKSALEEYLSPFNVQAKSIGLVPTMGALHEGHASLLETARSHCEVVVCSIFVNPTQFDDPKDLEKYPRTTAADVALLESAQCDVLFLPAVDEMYGEDESWHLDLGNLERVWEGAFRPGHFQGVTQIVYKLFKAVRPDLAFFGQKDFQQCMVVQRLVEQKTLPIKLVICPTARAADGLALSSRNARLSAQGLEDALWLSRALRMIQSDVKKVGLEKARASALAFLGQNGNIRLEYLAICSKSDLQEAHACQEEQLVALVAAYVEEVRLIDNMLIDCQ